MHDEAGNILDANPAACRRLGYTREELLKLNTRDIDAPEFAVGFQNRLLVMVQWAWSYVSYERGARLITGPWRADEC